MVTLEGGGEWGGGASFRFASFRLSPNSLEARDRDLGGRSGGSSVMPESELDEWLEPGRFIELLGSTAQVLHPK